MLSPAAAAIAAHGPRRTKWCTTIGVIAIIVTAVTADDALASRVLDDASPLNTVDSWRHDLERRQLGSSRTSTYIWGSTTTGRARMPAPSLTTSSTRREFSSTTTGPAMVPAPSLTTTDPVTALAPTRLPTGSPSITTATTSAHEKISTALGTRTAVPRTALSPSISKTTPLWYPSHPAPAVTTVRVTSSPQSVLCTHMCTPYMVAHPDEGCLSILTNLGVNCTLCGCSQAPAATPACSCAPNPVDPFFHSVEVYFRLTDSLQANGSLLSEQVDVLNHSLSAQAAIINTTFHKLNNVASAVQSNSFAVAETQDTVAALGSDFASAQDSLKALQLVVESQSSNITALTVAEQLQDDVLDIYVGQLHGLRNVSDHLTTQVVTLESFADSQQSVLGVLNATLLTMQAKLDSCESTTAAQQLQLDELFALVVTSTAASAANFVSSSPEKQPNAKEISDSSNPFAGIIGGVAALLVVVLVAFSIFFVQRNKGALKLALGGSSHGASVGDGKASGPVSAHKAVHIAFDREEDTSAVHHVNGVKHWERRAMERRTSLVSQIQGRLAANNSPSWESLQVVLQLVEQLVDLVNASEVDEASRIAVENAMVVLQGAKHTFQLQLDVAVAEREYTMAAFYNERVDRLHQFDAIFGNLKWMADSHPGTSGDSCGNDNVTNRADECTEDDSCQMSATDAEAKPQGSRIFPSRMRGTELECVAPGLLLRRDRFAGKWSPAFLGRGASSAVSRGTLTEIVGSTRERRTVVAVKEVPRSFAAGEQKAVRELVVVNEKLGAHSNIVQILTTKFTGSTCYIVMELCQFALDKQPRSFQTMLHSIDSGAGALVMNALLQDLVRGVAFLHSRGVFHCDIKPANVLVAFDRDGKKRKSFKPQYFKAAQLKLADFGVSRVIHRPVSFAGLHAVETDSTSDTTATVSLNGLDNMDCIAGTQAYMCPELLCVLNELKNDHQHVGRVDVVDGMLEANDAFGCGCVVGFLCSRGMHPFGHANRRDVPKNILANKRNLECLCEIKEPRHLELLNRLTAHELTQRWTVTYAHSHSRIFDTLSVASISTRNDFGNNAGILIDTIQFHERPSGSCRDQLLRPDLVSDFPKLPALVDKIEAVLRNEPRFSSRQARSRLDQNSQLAILSFTYDNGVDRDSNIYYLLNRAVRRRVQDPAAFQRWRGFLFYLMRGLEKLPTHKGLVFRGGNEGLGQSTVRREYKAGRIVQWSAFSSATTCAETAKEFIEPAIGVLFKLSVVGGRHIGQLSYIPKEDEVLLSPNTRFVVARELYLDLDGYYCVDMVETTEHIALVS